MRAPDDADVRRAVDTLHRLDPDILRVSPAEARGAFREAAKAYAKARRAIRALPFWRPEYLVPMLEREEQHALAALAKIPTWRRARARDQLKLAAAVIAREILQARDEAVTLTYGGPWPKLAARIYEQATGTEEVEQL